MVLDARIPAFIGQEVESIMDRASEKFNIKASEINKWAIHPGGKKIVDTIKKQLKLSDEDLNASYKVLNEYGNMSSPTILFVLDELMETSPVAGENIFSIGFGPGLSIETALMKYE
jgi:predicted naringenin-chalcone synthase